MKALFVKYKTVIKFILTFLLVYAVLTLSYKYYLHVSETGNFYPDYFTNLTARQSQSLLESLGYNTQIAPHAEEPSIKLTINGKYLARVIEGCNSISIIILFVSFIIAFADKWKTTLLYLFAGSVLIYAVNIFRIVLLCFGLYHYPWRKEILHVVIFPLIIYGMVFLLWMFWVNRFSRKKKHNA
ncbi:MAG: exosortase family protein XrtF [Flavobacteriaceae bacterium]|nr:exosortase family protein XrtF [Flavobacteriaceae bacterium]